MWRRKCAAATWPTTSARTKLIADVKAGDRRVDVLCNNAGYGTFGKFHELDLAGEVDMVRLNVLALQELTGAFLPDMV